ncbi:MULTISPECIES: lysozyme [unclassified Streptomyces]|uniref:lysozyme n=1 Tax=unclassified Streptomyces TaxID=2593676 RepID=UPI00225B5512|nr:MULTISPECIES: lysozyme [unclassified Streptomyces]WSP57485.1 lysozyme [Streptomyces sp. NBC_01241]WSU21777.1 lysozyme [Streptomyces sp. NBC_01108]MCX4789340.1 lysozyme [Streptomyces sp. NBC_01221]WSJ36235.1 lysozyme [Streptomyces sp. NBC_01321]WSP62688.1 lysozyme [Streptomyces sp. NBC_01240]
MPVLRSASRTSRRSRLAAAGTLLAALSLLLTLPGAASAAGTNDTATAAKKPARGTATMGMGVVAHDGQGGLPRDTRAAQTEGVDVASYQGNVDWATLWNSGVRWAYTKATEGTYYTNPYFAQQYNGSYNVGMIRGSYHFATPNTTSGAVQANYFVDHGGGWSKDGKTLPGALDIEWNPYGDQCYGLSQAAMVNWIRDFVNTYKARTGRDAVIYTATSWWQSCTGNNAGFGATNPLWVARYNSTVGELPAGWGYYTMWQYTSSGPYVGDHSHFNGALDRVQALANG